MKRALAEVTARRAAKRTKKKKRLGRKAQHAKTMSFERFESALRTPISDESVALLEKHVKAGEGVVHVPDKR